MGLKSVDEPNIAFTSADEVEEPSRAFNRLMKFRPHLSGSELEPQRITLGIGANDKKTNPHKNWRLPSAQIRLR